MFCLVHRVHTQELVSQEQVLNHFTDAYLLQDHTAALTKIDSLITVKETKENSDLLACLLERRSQLYLNIFDNDKAYDDLKHAIALAKTADMQANLADFYSKLGLALARKGASDEMFAAIDSMNSYLEFSPPEKQIEQRAFGKYLGARMLDRAGQFEEALEAYLEVINLSEEISDYKRIMDVYLQLGFVNKAIGNFDKAIESYEESLYYSIQNKDTSYIVYNLSLMGGDRISTAFLNGQLSKNDPTAINAYGELQRAYRLAIERNKPNELEFVYSQLSKYYEAVGEYEKALENVKNNRIQSKLANNKETELSSYSSAAGIYIEWGRYDLAIKEAKLGVSLAEEIGSYFYLRELYSHISRAADSLKNTTLAYEYFRKYTAVRDSIYDEETINRINELQTKYDTEKKEAEIQSLSQKAEIQSLEISQRNLIILVGTIVFILAIITLYFIYAQRHATKQRKQIELEQRFLRSQLNPHFISNALVAVQSSILEKDIENTGIYLNRFSRLMREILENSRHELIPIEDEIAMLQDYLELNRQRLKEGFEYTITVDESIDQELDQIPPMFVQPFVENAIEHGMPPDVVDGKIDIYFLKKSNTIQVIVEDNGAGLSATDGSHVKRQSLSTQIIKERIALFSKSSKEVLSLNIEDLKNEDGKTLGVKVALSIPLAA
ncbi:MAG: histidine kinase [Bacteroidota bacterium]